MLMNAQGLQSSQSFKLFYEYVKSKNPSFVAICESWLDSFDVKSFHLDGYKIANFFCRSKKKRGGVLLLVNNNFRHSWKKIKTKSVECEFEVCAIETTIENKKLKIFLLYRPSNQICNAKMNLFYERLGDLLEQHSNDNSEIILMGDFNVNLLAKNSHSDSLSDLMQTFNLKLLNELIPTRVANTSSTLLDQIYSDLNCEYKIDVEQISFSDHDCVQCNFDIFIEPEKDQHKLSRDYSDNNWLEFFEALSKETWNDVYAAPNIDTMSSNFMNKLVEYFEQSFPLKKFVIRANQQNKIKLSAATKELKLRVREFSEQICTEKNNTIKIALRKQHKTLKGYLGFCINNERRLINNRKIENSSNKSKVAWQIINKNTGKLKTSTAINSLKVNGEIITDQKSIANCLNQKFVEPVPDINNDDLNTAVQHIPMCEEKLTLDFVSENEVLKIIQNLPAKNSVSWDGISTKVIKKIAPYVALPLSCIINQSFQEGKFPENLKLSLVTPIYKKDERQDPGNYRPISITSPVSKILEKAFLAQLVKHLENNKILSERQHGFQKGKSTVTALFDIVTEIYDCLENREKINLILYDFSNAFGCLVPQLLLKKLEKYGLRDQALSWIKTFLMDRTQLVQIKSLDSNKTEILTRSDVSNCSMGVPQGTILGPVGFSVYDNDFPLKVIIACLYLYADDSSVVVRGKNTQEVNFKSEIANQNVIDFSRDNYLRINAKKTNLLQIHTANTRQNENANIKINGDDVSVTHMGKLLGLKITDTFNWKTHCDEVVSKLRSAAYRLSMLRASLTLPSILKVYFADVQSHVLYTIVIWGGSPHLDKVFIAQKRCVRAMAGKRYWRGPAALDSCKPLFRDYNILTVYSLYILEKAKFVKKIP
jgi:exonuclease III